MIIDWYTIIFQIINFLVLVFLLRYFLYGPIIRMMDEREKRIVEREEKAADLKMKAEEEAQVYSRKKAELEEEKEAMFEEARTAAEEEKHKLLQKARGEVDETRKRWEEAFTREKESFIGEVRNRIARQSCAVARRCLEDLADARLEELIWDLFQEKLAQLPEKELAELEKSLSSDDNKLVLRSAFDPPENRLKSLKETLQDILSEPVDSTGFSTKTDPKLVCGLELDAGDYRIAWSVDNYLDDIEKHILEELEEKKAEVMTGEVPADGDREN